MIATITLNPCLDEHVIVNRLMVEEANRWSRLNHYAGGKGINVSRAIHEMGGATMAYGFSGGHNGRLVEILLDREGVPFSFTPIKDETRVNFIITDATTGQQTRIDAPGPRISKSELNRFFRKLRKIRPSPDIMVASGSVPLGVPATIYRDIISDCSSYQVKTILDTTNEWLAEGIKAKPYLIKPNVHEAQELLGRELPNEEAVIQAALDMVEMGVEIVVISRGKEGFIATNGKEMFKAVSPSVKVRSSVGAGDCTVAGFALKLATGEPLIEACRLAAAMGAACAMTPGTELCHRTDARRLLSKIQITEIPVMARAKMFF
ncbi:MAG: 1-phosphofructokinase [Chloroflexi bacterium]|nr:1-phosphofructokinase [Chloroflexota bacterium]